MMREAFQESIGELSNTLGNDPAQWQWGKLHTREIYSRLGPEPLSYGPRASGGDEWTLNHAPGGLMSLDPTFRSLGREKIDLTKGRAKQTQNTLMKRL